ncbi:hypothetical protein L3X38_038767 [Prunus dulcis]|uniref:Uncharacterized protein n=1 Tax=Prunus dulcis TaxID=3755 RepID=A0AAD4YRY4_PRUDU|nr:hypothetical protein L3X38_038767 [Prunus dulcis]
MNIHELGERSISDSESTYDSESNAFDGKSSNNKRDFDNVVLNFESADSEDAKVQVVDEQIRAPPSFYRGKVLQPNPAVSFAMVSCGGACASTSQYCKFLMGDTQVPDRHASYHSETSTSGWGEAPIESSSLSAVTVVSPGNPRV